MAARSEHATVVGVFHEVDRARDAIDALKDAGFRADDIGILAPDRDQARDLAKETGTQAPEGAATGALAGGILGGLAGWLVGIGALAIPGVGPFVAAGALATTLGGAAVGAGVGAIAGALVGMGVPDEDAKYYEQEVRGGRTLVTVQADGRYDEARRILRGHGAYDVEDRGGAYGTEDRGSMAGRPSMAGRTEGQARMASGPSMADQDRDRERTIPLREEELRAQKETRTGEVNIRKEVHTQQQSIDVPVTHEEVHVERRPVDHRPADRPVGEGETIRVPLREERVEVEKQPVVYEEVEVSKRPVTETQHFTDTVRREELDVDQHGVQAGHDAGRYPHWDEVADQHRGSWQSRYGSSGRRWEDAEPYHRYFYEMAGESRYRDRDFDQVEPELRRGYGDWARRNSYRHDDSTWDQMREEMRARWQETRSRSRTR